MTADLFESMRKTVDEKDNDQYLVKLCLDITLYYQNSFLENAEGIVHFYRKSLEVLGTHLKYYRVDGQGRFKRLRKDSLDLLPFWASPEALKRAVYGLDLEGGASADEVSDWAFETYNGLLNPGWVRLMLPLEFIEHGAEQFVELARSAAAPLRFLSGHGGYAVHMPLDYNSHFEGEHIYALSRRYLGIDFDHPLYFSRFLEDSIKCVNWLTFVGDGLLARIGGREALAAQSSPAITVHPLPYGVMIQAGPAPGFGDVNRRETLPYYREVGRVLKPLRIPEDVLGPYDGVGGSENTRQWLARFDD